MPEGMPERELPGKPADAAPQDPADGQRRRQHEASPSRRAEDPRPPGHSPTDEPTDEQKEAEAPEKHHKMNNRCDEP